MRKFLAEFLVRKQMPPLPAVRTCRVQTDQGNARAALLEINAIDRAVDLDVHVAADHRLDMPGHDALPG